MVRWYYSTNGKAEGPVTSDFLIEQLKAGKFTLVDLVFKEGESSWKTFGEVPEFRDAYQAPPPFVPPVPQPVAQKSAAKPEIELDEISIDEFTPTPILSKAAPAVSEAPVRREEPPQRQEPTVTVAAPQETYDSFFVPESTSVKEFTKPEEGWPTDWRLSSSWIILRKRADGSGYDQDGPFTAEHIIDMIGTGKIDYSQYCWKPGYTRWFRIGNLPEFDRRKRDRDNDTVNQIIPVPAITEALPALTREELLANVENMRREKREKEKAPAGTTGKNLAETPLERATAEPVIRPTQAEEKKAARPKPEPVVATSVSEPTAAPAAAPASVKKERTVESSSPKAATKMVRVAVAAVAALVVVFVLFQFATSKNRLPASQPSSDAPSKSRKARGRVSENEAPAAAAPVAAQPKVASSLEISPKNMETAPVLTFQTDMGAADKIVVKIKAHSGDILGYASYGKTFEVAKPGVDDPQLDLAKEGLPQGSYFVEAAVGSAQASTQIFIGKQDEAFATELEHHLKSISLRQQNEKAALYYGAVHLEKLTKDLAAESQAFKAKPLKWKKVFTTWKAKAREAMMPVLALAHSPETDKVYPEALAAFKEATEHLAQRAKDIDAAVAQKRDVAAVGDDLTGEFTKLREDSAKLSSRPAGSE